jgi:diamine N-acetyltransferase
MALLLKSKVLILRGLEPEDLEFLYASENDTEIWTVSNTFAPYSRYVLKQYLENSHHDIYTNKQLRLIIASISNPQEPLGAIDLFDFDPFHLRAGIGILIQNKNNRGKGLASEALRLLIDYCFNHLKLHQLFCNIGARNASSIHLFEKAGFKSVGIKKEWMRCDPGWEDEIMYQLINQ